MKAPLRRQLLCATALCAAALCASGSASVAQAQQAPPPAGAAAVPPSPLKVDVVKNLAYAAPEPAGSQGHLLNLYVPRGTGGPVPVVLWVAGSGGLLENGRDGSNLVAAHLNPAGIAVAGVAIRSSGNATFPGRLSDIKAALRWLRANAARDHLDPGRIGILGESSGGWTAVMAAVTGGNAALEGDVGVQGRSSAVPGAVAFFPPTDFRQMDPHMIGGGQGFNRIFGLHGDWNEFLISPASQRDATRQVIGGGAVRPAESASPNRQTITDFFRGMTAARP